MWVWGSGLIRRRRGRGRWGKEWEAEREAIGDEGSLLESTVAVVTD